MRSNLTLVRLRVDDCASAKYLNNARMCQMAHHLNGHR